MPAPSFALLDAAGNPAVIHEDDTSAQYTIRLTNQSPGTLPLVAGPPLSEDDVARATDGATRWYLSFPENYDESGAAKLAISADGWAVASYPFGSRTYLGFVPTGNDTLAPDDTVDFTVYGLVVKSSNALHVLDLSVDWYVGPVQNAATLGMSAPVVSPEDNSFSGTLDATTTTLYVSDSKDYANTIRLNFQNGPAPLPQGGTVTIEVPISPASAAMTTPEFAQQISCAIAGDPPDSPWEVTPQPSADGNRLWTLTSTATGTQPALQPNETLVVEIRDVVTRLEGSSAVVVVSIQGFPAFPETIEQPLPLTLLTLPQPTISGYISQTSNSGAAGAQPFPYDSAISVTWNSEFATAVSIAYDDSIAKTAYAHGVPLSGAQDLPLTTVDAIVTLVATNDRFSSTTTLPIAVVPTALTLTVTSGIAAWDFNPPSSQASQAPGPPTVTYTIAATPARLLTGLAATTPAGTTVLEPTATSFAFTQTAASGQLSIAATFGGGIGADQKPTTVTLTTEAPAITPLPSYLIGTSWSDPSDPSGTFTFADAQTISIPPIAPYIPDRIPYVEDGNIIFIPQPADFSMSWMWTPPRITNSESETAYTQNNPPPLPSSMTTITPPGALPRSHAAVVEDPLPFDPPKPWVLGTIMADLASRFGVSLPWLNGTLALDTVSLTAEGTQSGTCTLGGALALGKSSRFDASVSFAKGDDGKKTFSITGTITVEDVVLAIAAAQGDAVDVSLTSSAGITLARIAGWFGIDLSDNVGPVVHTIAIHHDLSGKGNGFSATSDRITALAASDGTNRLVTIDVAVGLTFVHTGLTVPGVTVDVDFGAKSVQLAIANAALDEDAVTALGTLLPPSTAFAVAQLPLAAGATLAISLVLGPDTNVYALPLSKQDDGNGNGDKPSLSEAAQASTTATLGIHVDKSIGPIHLERLTIGYSDGTVTLGIEGGFALDGLTLDFEGLQIDGTFGDDTIGVDLSGLALALQGDAFTIAGEFLIEKNAAYDGGHAYSGGAILAAETLSIGAAGSWGTIQGEPSLFVWGEFDEPLGGPPFCFVRGVSAAFGLNRSLTVPSVQDLATFPLIQAAMADADHPNPLAGMAPVDVLQSLESVIQPAYGEKWAAAGLRFTSFGVVEGFALLVIQFGSSITFQLLGVGAASLPKGAENPLAYVELPVEVTVDPARGSVLALARLAPSSYVLDPDCRLQGGFAFGAWFKDDAASGARAGDFVYTLGGYHPAFAAPSYYPSVPRLSAHWANGDLTIDGTYYFALTSAALMAGGSLQAVWESGPVRAWFDADADFLIAWRPFAYDAEVGISIGASFTIDLLLTSVEMTIHVGVDIHFWGPPFQGDARVDLDIISFTVSFGANTDTSEKTPISWADFKTGFFPPSTNAALDAHALALRALGTTPTTDVSVCRARVTKGLLKTIDPSAGSTAPVTWVVDGATFELTTETAIPAKAGYLATGESSQPTWTPIDGTWNATGFDVGPVGVTNADLLSDHTVSLRGIAPAPLDPTPELTVTAVTGSVAGTAWSIALAQQPTTSTINSNVAPIANALTGVRLAPKLGPSEAGLPQPLALARLEFANDPHVLHWSWTSPMLPASTTHAQGQAATDRVTATVDDLAYVARRNALAVAAFAAGLGVTPGGRLTQTAATFTNTAPPLLRTLGET